MMNSAYSKQVAEHGRRLEVQRGKKARPEDGVGTSIGVLGAFNIVVRAGLRRQTLSKK